jgi:hypothetical protein
VIACAALGCGIRSMAGGTCKSGIAAKADSGLFFFLLAASRAWPPLRAFGDLARHDQRFEHDAHRITLLERHTTERLELKLQLIIDPAPGGIKHQRIGEDA